MRSQLHTAVDWGLRCWPSSTGTLNGIEFSHSMHFVIWASCLVIPSQLGYSWSRPVCPCVGRILSENRPILVQTGTLAGKIFVFASDLLANATTLPILGRICRDCRPWRCDPNTAADQSYHHTASRLRLRSRQTGLPGSWLWLGMTPWGPAFTLHVGRADDYSA